MKPKAYLLLLSTIGAKTKITPDMLKEVRRILGPQTCPIMAWEMGATIGFISTDTARQTTDKIRDALGGRMQIMVASWDPTNLNGGCLITTNGWRGWNG